MRDAPLGGNITVSLDGATCDIAVIGGGIVGLATMLALSSRHPDLRLLLLEKEPELAAHQTGHNSGVIHSGIYYRPESRKARLCIEGARLLKAFCEEHSVHFESCGKVIVATGEEEFGRLDDLLERGTANGVQGLRRIGPEELREIEPHAVGRRAIHSPVTAIVDFREVAGAMAAELGRRGAGIATGARVTAISSARTEAVARARLTAVARSAGCSRSAFGLLLETTRGQVRARWLVNCAGLYSDRIAAMAGVEPGVRIVPFRGEYCMIRPDRRHLVRGLIYPVPDPAFPFLGVHLTRTIHGEVEAGPNAVLAFAREGYTLVRISPPELLSTLFYPGFGRIVRRYWRTGMHEMWRSVSTRAFARAIQRLVPEVRLEDVVRHGSGVRAQAVLPDGAFVDDFHVVEGPGAIHVLNAPSPAATASLAIGRHIAGLAESAFGLGPRPG